jgi:hypothetical protein
MKMMRILKVRLHNMAYIISPEEYEQRLDEFRQLQSYNLKIPVDNSFEEVVDVKEVTEELLMTPINKKLELLFVPINEEK